MLPLNTLSSSIVYGPFLAPDSNRITPGLDYEQGGVALNDPSQGLQVRTWVAYIKGNAVHIGAEGIPSVILFTRTGLLSEISLAFDQNMRPAIAFVESGVAWLYYYDSLVEAAVFVSFAGVSSPKVCLDDKRALQLGTSDIIFTYVRANNLYFRAQRDRFLVEYLLYSVLNAKLIRVGMTTKNRLQFELQP